MEFGTLNYRLWWLPCLMLLLVFINTASSEIRPPIYWDPYHPLFTCEDPIIHVKKGDKLRFVCPSLALSTNPQATVTTLYEKATLLDYTQVEDFNNCNATVNKVPLVSCEGEYKATEHFVQQFSVSPNAPSFELGKTYFVIGTSFRYKENLNKLVGGSCFNTSTGGNRLRLKIHVCSEAEVSAGKCNLCSSEGCYYKSCGKSCTLWQDISNTQRGQSCYLVQKRTCNNSIFQENKDEYQEILTTCGNQVITGAAKKQSSSDSNSANEANTYKYVSGGVAVVALIIGLVVGALCYKMYHGKNCYKPSVNPSDIESKCSSANSSQSAGMTGTDNGAFEGNRYSMQLSK